MGQGISSSHDDRKYNRIINSREKCKGLHRSSANDAIAPLSHSTLLSTVSLKRIGALFVFVKRLYPRNSLPTALNSHARVLTIPTEVLVCIKAYLPPSSLLSLSYTCKTFYLSSTVVVEDLFPKQPTAGYDGVEQRTEQLAFLCMLERDRRLSKSKIVCSSCIQVQPTSSFSISAVRDRPSERQCRGHEGKLWICPHKVWDYAQIQAFRDDPDRYQPAAQGARNYSWPYGPCACGNHSVWLGVELLTLSRPLLAIDTVSKVSEIAVANALRHLNIQICPHIKANDPVVRRRFSEDCKVLKIPGCDCSRCKAPVWQRKCRACKTMFNYELDEPLNGKRTLKLVVRRPLPDFQGVSDPDWTSQLSHPREFEASGRAWNACPVDFSIQETRQSVQPRAWRIAGGKGWESYILNFAP